MDLGQVRKFLGNLRGDVTIISVVVTQSLLVALAYFGVLSTFFSAPIIVGIALIATWIRTGKQSQQESQQTLVELKTLLEEFGSVFFRPQSSGNNFNIVKLVEPPMMPEGDSSVREIMNLHSVFSNWLETLKGKVGIMSSIPSRITEYEWVSTVNQVVALYEGYVENVAEAAINLANMYMGRSQQHRETFLVFRENLQSLRGRLNQFLRAFQAKGHMVNSIEVKALTAELQ